MHENYFNQQTEFDVLLGICLAKAISIKDKCKVLSKITPREMINTILKFGFDFNFRHYTPEKVSLP